MTKSQSRFVCQGCGYQSPRWLGRCFECGEYGTFVEEPVRHVPARGSNASTGIRISPLTAVAKLAEPRIRTGVNEFDRVVGGGLVPGSVVLLGGEPGIGKSTLLLQVLGSLSASGSTTLYVSGEESPEQIGLRAERIGVDSNTVFIAGETDIRDIAAACEQCHPSVAVIDSIQTVSDSRLDSAPGTISQVREAATAFLHLAKESRTVVLLVGHVTKEGSLAGPKAVEHIVDAVLTFEGDPHHAYRILRATKNRFGPTHEAGVFAMRSDGLVPVENPSGLFLDERYAGTSGSCISACMEGARPILAEIQALVTPSYYGTPRRMTTGVDYNRCCVILAVLEKRLGMHLGNQDVHVNVIGGLRLSEPGVDLAIAMACVSSFRDVACPEGAIAFGEVGLGGEIRGVPYADRRVDEASRLGIKMCILPRTNIPAVGNTKALRLIGVSTVSEATDSLISLRV